MGRRELVVTLGRLRCALTRAGVTAFVLVVGDGFELCVERAKLTLDRLELLVFGGEGGGVFDGPELRL